MDDTCPNNRSELAYQPVPASCSAAASRHPALLRDWLYVQLDIIRSPAHLNSLLAHTDLNAIVITRRLVTKQMNKPLVRMII
jgi:hypothetical protein